jgi:NTE family protein
VTIGQRRYIDGGVGSTINLQVVGDCGTAVVLVPLGKEVPSPFGGSAATEFDEFGGAALGVFADDDSLAAFGPNPLDPNCRPASAQAGRAQGRREAAAVAQFLGV